MDRIQNDFSEPKLREIHQIITKTDAKDIQMQAVLMTQNKEKEEIWSVRDLRITEPLAEKIKKNALEYIEEHADIGIKDFTVTNDQSGDYLIEKLSDSEVPVLNKIISEMNRDDNSDISYEKLASIQDLKGFAISFSRNLIIFNKVTKNTLLKPKKYLFMFPSETGEFTELEEQNLLSIPKSIDVIFYEDPLFIFNRNNFIQMFRYEDTFDHFITDNQQSLGKIVDDVSYLINNSKPDIRKYRRLASACAGYVKRIVQKGIPLEPIARDYNFDITFSNGKIEIQNSKLGDVLKLLNAQAMKDAIFGDKYIAQEKTKV